MSPTTHQLRTDGVQWDSSHKAASIEKLPRYRPRSCNCGGLVSGYVGGKLTSNRILGGSESGPTSPPRSSPSSHRGRVTSYRIRSPVLSPKSESKTASSHVALLRLLWLLREAERTGSMELELEGTGMGGGSAASSEVYEWSEAGRDEVESLRLAEE